MLRKKVAFRRGLLTKVANELRITRQAVDSVAKGHGRSRRVEIALARHTEYTVTELFGPPSVLGRKGDNHVWSDMVTNLEWANGEIERLIELLKKETTK